MPPTSWKKSPAELVERFATAFPEHPAVVRKPGSQVRLNPFIEVMSTSKLACLCPPLMSNVKRQTSKVSA